MRLISTIQAILRYYCTPLLFDLSVFKKSFKPIGARSVVTNAIMTTLEYRADTMGGVGAGTSKRPADNATAATTNSTAPRPFIPVPIAKDCRPEKRSNLATMPQPNILPIIAATINKIVNPNASLKAEISIFKPIDAKKNGARKPKVTADTLRLIRVKSAIPKVLSSTSTPATKAPIEKCIPTYSESAPKSKQ